MLYLAPPFRIIDGISLFRDHSDPKQWYFGPLMPHFSTEFDEAVDADIPRLSLIKYRGDAGTGGFLNFDVDLGVKPEKLEDVAVQLMAQEQLDELPRLAPINYVDGSVRLMMLGADSAAEEADPPPEGGPRFVTRINHANKPALFGDNNAVFSVELGPEGIEVLEKSLAGELAPIGVVYSLDFLALRPAYEVSLEINWDRVQKHVNDSHGVDSIFASVEIEKTVDELIEEQAIKLEATSEFLETDENAGLMGRRDQALNDVRAMVTEAFFEPSIVPEKKEESGWDKAVDATAKVAAIAATGGWGGIAKFKRKHVEQQRIDKKRLNVNYSERTTVLRSIYPQRHLDGMFRLTRDAGVPLSRFTTAVDLGSAWFRRRRLTLSSNSEFGENGVAMVLAHLRYGDDEKSVRLDADNPNATVEFTSIVENDRMRREMELRYEVIFKDDAAAERPTTLHSEPIIVTADEYAISPTELYSIAPIEIDATSVPFDDYPVVEVHTSFQDVTNKLRQRESYRLDAENPKARLDLFYIDPETRSFDVRVVYHAKKKQDIELPLFKQVDELLSLDDPFPNKRKIQVRPLVSWRDVSMIFVDLTYVDSENDLRVEESLTFDPDDKRPKTIEFGLEDPQKRAVSYRVTILFNDGGMVEVPESITHGNDIRVRADMKGRRVVTVTPPQIDFERAKVKQFDVELAFEDPLMGLNFSDRFEFDDPDDRGVFEFDYADEQRDKYRFKVTQRMSNGAKKVRDWSESDDATLELTEI